MKAVQPVPHGKIEWPRWHPERHHALQQVLGLHRASVLLAGFAVIVATAVIGTSAALAPARPTVSTAAVQTAMFAAYRVDAVGDDAMSLSALRKVFDQGELAAIAAARAEPATLRDTRQDERALDRQLKGHGGVLRSAVTRDPSALAAAQAEQRSLDRQVQAAKAGAEIVNALPGQFAGKPLPL